MNFPPDLPAGAADAEIEQWVVDVSRAMGLKPPTNDESLEQYCKRKAEEAKRDPQHQLEMAIVDSCTRPDDTIDMEKLQRILDGKEPFVQ